MAIAVCHDLLELRREVRKVREGEEVRRTVRSRMLPHHLFHSDYQV